MKTSTVVLTGEQRSFLQFCLGISRDRFLDYAHARMTEEERVRFKKINKQFARQADEANALLNLVVQADEITISQDQEEPE